MKPNVTQARRSGPAPPVWHGLTRMGLLLLAFLRAAASRGWAAGDRRTGDSRSLRRWLRDVSDRIPDDAVVVADLLQCPPDDLFCAWQDLEPAARCAPAAIPEIVSKLVSRGGAVRHDDSGRRGRGRYYTPAGIARFIVRQTLPVDPDLDAERILETRILDLSAGGGVFLEEAARHLAGAYAARAGTSLETALHEVTARCVYGVEVEPEAALVCRWSLRLLGARAGRLPDLSGHILERNALVGASLETFPWPVDPAHPAIRELADAWTWRCLAPERPWPRLEGGPDAFLAGLTPALRDETARMARDIGFLHPWLDLAPVAAEGFQAVVGNPPYLSEVRGGASSFRYLKRSPRTRSDYVPKGDLFHHFMLESVRLLGDGGRAGLLVPPYWRTRASAHRVRKALSATCTGLVRVDFGEVRLFRDASGHHSEILVLEKARRDTEGTVWTVEDPGASPDEVVAALLGARTDLVSCRKVPAEQILSARPLPPGPVLPAEFGTGLTFRIPAKDICQGLIMPQPTLSARGLRRLPPGTARVGDGIFWLRDQELEALQPSPEERRLVKPYLPAGCIRPFHAGRRRGWVLYLDEAAREALERHPGRYAALRAHLDRFAPAITSSHGPYQLHRARSPHWFEGTERVLVVRKAPRVIAARTNAPCYVDQGVNVIVVPNVSAARYLVALLSSRSVETRIAAIKKQGSMLQVDKEVLTGLELPRAPEPDARRRERVQARLVGAGWHAVVAPGVDAARSDPALTRAVIEALVDGIERRLADAARPSPQPEGWQARPGRGGRFASDLPEQLPEVEALRAALDQLVSALEQRRPVRAGGQGGG